MAKKNNTYYAMLVIVRTIEKEAERLFRHEASSPETKIPCPADMADIIF